MGQSSKPSSKPQKAGKPGKTPKNGKTPEQKAQSNSSFSVCSLCLVSISVAAAVFLGGKYVDKKM